MSQLSAALAEAVSRVEEHAKQALFRQVGETVQTQRTRVSKTLLSSSDLSSCIC